MLDQKVRNVMDNKVNVLAMTISPVSNVIPVQKDSIAMNHLI